MPVNPQGFQRLRTLHEAFVVTEADKAGPILRRLGQIHRAQEKRIFATQGAAGRFGRWAALSPQYLARKIRLLGTAGKILVLSGETRERFITPTNPDYIQQYIAPAMRFGARSSVAAAHFRGSGKLPKRDPISKTEAMLEEMREGIRRWWTEERLPQIQRGAARLS